LNSSPVFSILLPTNRADELLQRALRSLERAVNGSLDCETIIVLEGIGRIAPPPMIGRATRIAVAPSPGISAALNCGIRCATGEYIVRMDGDDLCHPGRFHCLRRLVLTMPDIIAGAIVKFGMCRARYERPPQSAQQALEDLLHKGYSFAHPASAVRRAAVVAAGGYDSRFDGCEDLDLWLRMLQGGATFASSRTPHLFYRVHQGQATAVDKSNLTRKRLLLAPNARMPCDEYCPGRLTSLMGLQCGNPAMVCRRYLADLRLSEIRSTALAPVQRRRAMLQRSMRLLAQELRAGWETRHTSAWLE
jgi:glycosyltransferase involved in cell wall biosynthesis